MLEHVVEGNIYVVQSEPVAPAFEVLQGLWGHRPDLPLITLIRVSGLAPPDFLAELEALAVVPG